MSSVWKNALIEGSMVLLGVLLALMADSWREDREFQKLVSLTEGLIVAEIKGNRDRMVAYREEFIERQTQLQAWGESLDPNESVLNQIEGFPGVPSTYLNRSAWTMANNSQMTEDLNFEFYDGAFELYAEGVTLEERLDIVFRVIFDASAADAGKTTALYKVMQLYFDDIIGNLEHSTRAHNAFLESDVVRGREEG